MSLTDRDRAMLDLEGKWWRHAGAKEGLILETFGLTVTRYYQILNGLIGRPEALQYAPQIVK